jgi:hypothetical protein
VGYVVAPERVDKGPGEEAPNSVSEVGVDLIPDITHGRQAVAEVGNARLGANIFGDGVTDGEDQIVALDLESLGRPGIEREKFSVMSIDTREIVQGGCPDPQTIDCRCRRALAVEEGVEIDIGKGSRQSVEYALAASHASYPVVDKCDSHGLMIAGSAVSTAPG